MSNVIQYKIKSKRTTVIEHYTIEFPELGVTVEMPIFNQPNNLEYLEMSIRNRYESEKAQLAIQEGENG